MLPSHNPSSTVPMRLGLVYVSHFPVLSMLVSSTDESILLFSP